MAPSATAADVIALAKKIRTTNAVAKQAPPKFRRVAVESQPMLAASDADAALLDGATIRPRIHGATPSTTLPSTADGARALAVHGGATIAIALQDATTAAAEFADGYLVYRNALPSAADIIVRPTRDGFEDHFYFAQRPESPHVEYSLSVPAGAGLRLVGNVLELVDKDGTPLMHASPPFLVDSAGALTRATLDVVGCAVDHSDQPSWKRKPVHAGAESCRVSVTWDDALIQYPALLDPLWTTAGAMTTLRDGPSWAVLTDRTPNLIVAIGGSDDAAGAVLSTSELFDPGTGTWSAGPSMHDAHYGGTATAFSTTPGGPHDRIFVAGGMTGSASAMVDLASTEILSSDASGKLVWTTSASMQTPREGHAAALTGNRILIAGGMSGASSSNPVASSEVFDLTTSTFVTPPPPPMALPRYYPSATTLADGISVLVVGGMGNKTDATSATAELFDGQRWNAAPPPPSKHYYHASALLPDGRVLIVGGYFDPWDANATLNNEADFFVPATATAPAHWLAGQTYATQAQGGMASAILANGAALFAPGFTTSANTTTSLAFDPRTSTWSTTTTIEAHVWGGAATVAMANGATKTVIFGGIGVSNTPTNVTEIFNLTATGGSCGAGSECQTGICTGAVCVPPGFPITIDATSLTQKGLALSNAATVFDTTTPQQVYLVPGTYSLVPYKGLTSVAFTVNSDGTVSYDPSLEGVLSGSGGKTLKVNGRRINIDARHLSQPQLQLLAYHFNQGAEVDRLPFSTAALQSFVLLPLPDFGYQFDVDGASLADLSFRVDVAGNVHIPSAQSYLATGEGTTTLTIGGAHISITVPSGLGNATLANGITLPEGKVTDVYLLPYSGQTPFTLKLANQTVTLGVTASGDVIGDLQTLYVLQAHGDGAPFCSGEDVRLEQNGWMATPLNCRGAARGDGSNEVDSATPAQWSPRLTGPGRVPNELPRFRKPAGGDPVLGDGEFFFQRVDASLAGFGLQYQFRRTYRSGLEKDSPLGVGWDHNFNQRLLGTVIFDSQASNLTPWTAGDIIGTNCEGEIHFQDGEGSVHTFALPVDKNQWTIGPDTIPYQTFHGEAADLTLRFYLNGSDTHWQLTRADGTVSVFDQAGFLKSITDLAGNKLTFSWAKATPVDPPPNLNCFNNETRDPACDAWLYSMISPPIGQRRRLASVTDASRTVYYVYSQTDATKIQPNDRLQCISLTNGVCSTAADGTNLVHFNFDNNSRLTSVGRGSATATPIETYVYHAVAFDTHPCRASAELPVYCDRLCSPHTPFATGLPNPGTCNNLDYEKQVDDLCRDLFCTTTPVDECTGGKAFPLQNGTQSYSLCCSGPSNKPNGDVCRTFLFGGANCFDGCEQTYQCQDTRGGTLFAIYAGGNSRELNNDITDIKDSQGNLVVHNVYGEDRSLVSFDKVITQQLASASTDNTITFEYHDLFVEGGLEPTPVFVGKSGPPQWTGAYSSPDPAGNVQRYQLSRTSRVQVCPKKCPNGGTSCSVFDYDPARVDTIDINLDAMTAAVVIHDLHGLTRIQYVDQSAKLIREVTVETNEVTDYQYLDGLVIGVNQPSGVRSCMERDADGRVTQSSLVPAAGFAGSAITQATTMTYDSKGVLTDVVRNALGTPVKTHYERDEKSRVKWTDQDVRAGAAPLRTLFAYDGETPPAGILESPTMITYPNGRIDRFSNFDPNMGGPGTTVIDAASDVPVFRYAAYDNFGRTVEQGETNRFAQRYQYLDPSDIWRLTSTGHRDDSTKPWIDVTTLSHLVNGQLVVDSVIEPKRRTNFTNVGLFPTQKDVVATWAPPETTPPPTETSCFNYSPDGRLEEELLPEGNGLAYSYAFSPFGSGVRTYRGFGLDTTGAWAAGCRGRAAPKNDPGVGPPAMREFRPGGFVLDEVDTSQVTRSSLTDGFGRILQVTTQQSPSHPVSDPIPPVVQLGYDSAGHRIWQASRAPTVTQYGKPSSPDASVLGYAEYDYDLVGRVIAERVFVTETGEVLSKTVSYDDINNTVTTTDRGVTTITTNDNQGRVTSTTLPDGSSTTVVHQGNFDVATVQSNSQGKVARTFNYDTRHRLLSIQDAKNALLYQATYDDDNNQLTETRAGLGPVTWTYDALGRLIREDKTLGLNPSRMATSLYGYDRNDRLTSYFDAASSIKRNPWTMTFTGADAPLSVTDPLLRVGTYTYGTELNWPDTLVANMQEPNGRVTSFAYDTEARLIDVFNGACPINRNLWECNGVLQSQRHLTYDTRGNVQQVDAPTRASVQTTYDSLGRVTDEIVGGQSTVHHAFADAGRTETTDVSYGSTVFPRMTHRFDGMGRLHSVELAGQTAPLATYDFGVGVGGPLSLAYSNGAKATYSYDAKLRQTGIDVTFTRPGTTTSTFVTGLHEAFGADSIPRLRQHRIAARAPLTDAFQVDSDGRITAENLLVPGVTLPAGEIDNAGVASYMAFPTAAGAAQYTLDNIGNIKQKATKNSTLIHTVDTLSRLTALGGKQMNIDPTDNLDGIAGQSPAFVFDQFSGSLTSATNGATTSTFTYDALGRRRGEHRSNDNSDRVYVWDGQRLVAHGTAANLTLDVAGNDIDAHVVSIDSNGKGARWWYHQGPDQSVLAVTGANGFVEAYTYSAFGELSIWSAVGQKQSKSVFGNVFQYQGQLFDAATATYSMRARQYQPTWGRFLSPDPISTAGGPSLYAFTGSRPLHKRDPSGTIQCSFGNCWADGSEPSVAMAMSGNFESSVVDWTTGNTLAVMGFQDPSGTWHTQTLIQQTFSSVGHNGTEFQPGPHSDYIFRDVIPDHQSETGDMAAAVLHAIVKLPLSVHAILCRSCDARVDRMVEGLTGNHLGPLNKAMAGLWLAALNGLASAAFGGAAAVGETGLATTSTGELTSAEFQKITDHLMALGAAGEPENVAMMGRLLAGNNSAWDMNFAAHELVESELMGGVYGDYDFARAAHLDTLEVQGIEYLPGYEAKLYHPDVISRFADQFNPAAWPKP